MVAILAIIGAIAIPRMSASAANASDAALLNNWRKLQGAGELFAAEHMGLGIGLDLKGSVVTEKVLLQRLIYESTLDGTPARKGMYGPYLHSLPINHDNNLSTIRVDGAAAGAGTHGWRYDSATGVFSPDTEQSIKVLQVLH